MSANTAIQSALNARMASMPNRPPTAWSNKNFDAPTELYIRANQLPRETDTPFLGDDSAQDYGGIYQVTVMAPSGNYETEALAMADAICAHFPRGLELDAGGQVLRIRKTVVAPGFQDGTRWVVPVSVYYRGILSVA